MRHVIMSVVSVIMLVWLATTGFFLSTSPPAVAGGISCTLESTGGPNVQITCFQNGQQIPPGQLDLDAVAGEIVVSVSQPTVTTTATATATVKGPTKTSTVTVSPEPVRITKTATVVRTETVRPEPVRVTKTVTPKPVILTKTVTPEPRQESEDYGMIEPERRFLSKDIDFDDDQITAAEAGLGLFGLFSLVLAGFIGMYGGYCLGRDSRKSEDTDFMRALLDSAKLGK